jgi:uncharacterized protein (DUF1697 family)
MRWVGLVRNVMLGRDGLDRALLLELAARAGGSGVRSYLTTGNLTFDAAPQEIDGLCRRLEADISEVVSRPTMVAVRAHAWLCDLVSHDIFARVEEDEWECEVAFLRHDAPPIDPGSIPGTRRTRLVATYDRELATARPRSGSARPHVTRLLERAAGQPATARGLSTLGRIADDP